MSFIKGVDRRQPLLLPDRVEDYVPAEHVVRAIDTWVEALDLECLGFARAVPSATGRPPYSPKDLLRLWLWAYLNRITSSRRLEQEGGRNLEVIWLLRTLRPDFKTIAEFRRQNAAVLPRVFRQFVVLCRELNLLGRELVALDGTKLKASNHPTRRASAAVLAEEVLAIEKRIAEYLATAEKEDGATDLLGQPVPAEKKGDFAAKLRQLQREQEKLNRALAAAQASQTKAPLTDPDCQSMQKVGLGYNAQAVVDAKHHLLVVAELAASATDHAQLPIMAAKAQEILQAPELKVVADAGYHDQTALREAEAAGVQSYVPRPLKGRAAEAGTFLKSDFQYEAEKDAYRCLAGALLTRTGGYDRHGLRQAAYTNPAACRACALRPQCTKAKTRRIERWEHEAAMEAVAARTEARPDLIRRRKGLIEHVFGTIKFWNQQGAVQTRGRQNVQAELSLSALAYNFKRVLAVLGVDGFQQALERLRAKVRAAGVAQTVATAPSRPIGSWLAAKNHLLAVFRITDFWFEHLVASRRPAPLP